MPSNGFHIRRIENRHSSWNAPRARRASRGSGAWKKALAAPAAAWTWLWALKTRLGWKRFLLRGALAGAGVLVLYVGFLWITLPSVDERSILQAAQSTVIVDRNGVELYRIHGEQDRTVIPGTDMPETLRQAIVAIEDKRYHDRGCIDARALARAVLRLGQAGGASTITRQLARNALNLQRENILSRKVKELILGCQLEKQYSKEDLLTLYLNWIPFGQNAYGVEQASRRFLGKATKDLTLGESAVLASLPQLPSYFSPYGRHVRTTVSAEALEEINAGEIEDASELSDDDVSIGLLGAMVGSGSNAIYVGGRADQVLHNMEEQEFITEEERLKAVEELKKLTFAPFREKIRAAHFVLWVRDQVEATFEGSPEQGLLEQGGLTIQTTLDWKLQEAAEEVVAKHRETAKKVYGASNMALVAMDPKTREILAYVGNTEYSDEVDDGKIDMAQEPRQPGSSFKPIVYASAFENGHGPATVLFDVPTTFGDYEPQNFGGDFWGLMNARRALGASRNIPAVKAYFLGGEEDEVLMLAERMGIPTAKAAKPEQGYGAALAIGAAEVPLLEMVQGYATLADSGRFGPPSGILKITDRRGALVALPGDDETADDDRVPALDPRVAYQVTSILSDAGARPNEFWKSVLSVPGYQAAAKTGTSNKCLKRDEKKNVCLERKPDNVWTLGYTPALVTGVWVGNASNEPLSDKADGLTVAAPIWRDFMAKAHKIVSGPAAFPVPDGIVQVQVSMLSGELPTECTPVELRRSDVFLAERTPTKDDPGCVRLMVDKVTGLLASDECPAEAREERSFMAPYNAAGRLFPQWDGDVTEWAKKIAPATGTGGVRVPGGSGAALPLPLAPTEKCRLSLTPGRTTKPTLRIVSPQDGGTAGYPSFKPKISFTVGSKVRSVAYELDGKPAGLVLSAPFDPAIRVPKNVEKSGNHTLKVTLTDEYFNVVEATARFSFEDDRSGPSVTIVSPRDGGSFPKGTPLTIRAEAEEGDVKYVEFYLDELLLARKPRVPYELTYPGPIEPGTHEVRAVATDLAGNESEDAVTITVTPE